MRHQHERDRVPGEHDVVLGEPAPDLLLDAGAAVTELRQLDEMLQLQVVDVVDQPCLDCYPVRFPRHAPGPLPRGLHPRGDRPGARAREPSARVQRSRAGGDSVRRRDGRGHGGDRRQERARDRRPPERDVRQRAGADHRLLRAARGPPGGREGLDRRLDHRQRAAGDGRRVGRGWLDARQADLQPDRSQRPVGDADARAGRADLPRALPADPRRQPSRRGRRARGLRLGPREALARRCARAAA